MSTEFGMALSALIGVVVLSLRLRTVRDRIKDLENEIKMLNSLKDPQEKYIDALAKHFEQNAYNIRQLSESCSQVDDLDIKIRVCQKDIEHALEMIEDLKAKRSMDILDKLREEDEGVIKNG